MATALRVLVPDVDAALPGWQALGYEVRDRWGPPFAILSGPGPDVWLSGPQTSAAKITSELDAGLRSTASVRLVTISDDLAAHLAVLQRAGWDRLGETRSGPGGQQALMRRDGVIVECFQPA
jgi:hypothetical protein